jgi:hypothetical protein
MRKYDKDILLELINQAIGDRTIKSFSNDAGLSSDYMYRLFKGRFNDSPRKDTLKKIASASNSLVSYEELLVAAGYPSESSSTIFSDKLSSLKASLLLALANSNLDWGINNNEHKGLLSIKCTNTPYDIWSFITLENYRETADEASMRRINAYYYGLIFSNSRMNTLPAQIPIKLASLLMPLVFSNIKPSEKISFITESVDDYENFKTLFLSNLKINISIILINSANTNDIKETILSTAENYKADSIKIF